MMEFRAQFGWALQVFSLEIRKILAYRADFWIKFFLAILIQLVLAFFLWDAVFTEQGVSRMRGYDFNSLMLYYLLVSLVNRMTRDNDNFIISNEIYDGSLNRYLVYPVGFFAYKYVSNLARLAVSVFQFVLVLGLYLLFFGAPERFHFSLSSMGGALLLILAAGFLHFLLVSVLEMIAFWADNVWSLLILLRFVELLMGGGMIPLSFFPEWAQEILVFTPFPYFLSMPVRALMGELSLMEWGLSMTAIFGWSLVLAPVLFFLWRRGLKVYTGVGI